MREKWQRQMPLMPKIAEHPQAQELQAISASLEIILTLNNDVITFRKKMGQIVLDQIRTIDKKRLIKKLGTVDSKAQ